MKSKIFWGKTGIIDFHVFFAVGGGKTFLFMTSSKNFSPKICRVHNSAPPYQISSLKLKKWRRYGFPKVHNHEKSVGLRNFSSFSPFFTFLHGFRAVFGLRIAAGGSGWFSATSGTSPVLVQ
jgi:hypothetical protein